MRFYAGFDKRKARGLAHEARRGLDSYYHLQPDVSRDGPGELTRRAASLAGSNRGKSALLRRQIRSTGDITITIATSPQQRLS